MKELTILIATILIATVFALGFVSSAQAGQPQTAENFFYDCKIVADHGDDDDDDDGDHRYRRVKKTKKNAKKGRRHRRRRLTIPVIIVDMNTAVTNEVASIDRSPAATRSAMNAIFPAAGIARGSF